MTSQTAAQIELANYAIRQGDEQVAELARLRAALRDLLALVDKHGIGDDEAESEPVVGAARAALAQAGG